MTRKVLFILSFVSVLFIAGCGKSNKELVCTVENETFKYVYNDKELLEYHYNGEKQTGDIFDLALESVQTVGGIDAYITNTKTAMEDMFDGTCELKE